MLAVIPPSNESPKGHEGQNDEASRIASMCRSADQPVRP
jgi:hypothetical protein